uniref:Aldose 1-epimerase n=1 Tax=Entamoeba histolytica TaxID=5759 RepID=S0AXS2_ENTHI|nr:aldose 1-epimerase [Entamoeba histolytica]
MTTIVKREDFCSIVNGKEVDLYTLTNEFLTINLTNYGCRLIDIITQGKNGPVNVLIGFRSLKGIMQCDNCMGAIIGRYANKIYKGDLVIDSHKYQLPINNGINCLHGGDGFDKKVFTVTKITKTEVVLELDDKDGSNNFPGNVHVVITYKLHENNLVMTFEATTDQTTIVNITNHSYLNLNGEGSIVHHQLQIYSDQFLPITDEIVPTGEIRKVENTPFDFREFKEIGKEINNDYEQLKLGSGYDHSFIINENAPHCSWDKSIKQIANIKGDISEVQMSIYSSQPGVQFYTSNFMPEGFKTRSAFCLETQHFPDSPHHPEFPSTYLKRGDVYHHVCVYQFQ